MVGIVVSPSDLTLGPCLRSGCMPCDIDVTKRIGFRGRSGAGLELACITLHIPSS
jgi:hypothetical protein